MLNNLISKVAIAQSVIIFACFAVFAANPASATTFTFNQGGYGDGGKVSGSFTGEDLNLSGSLTKEELTDFTATYSDGQFPSFTKNLAQLSSFLYSPTSFAFSTVLVGDSDRAIWVNGSDMSYIVRSDDAVPGRGFCGSRCVLSASLQKPIVSPPFPTQTPQPIPESKTLLGLSLFGLGLLFSKKQKKQKIA
ncbi:MAG: hypothetical protein ACHBN1_13965 [Heteroscytonema crispum UTEX LB 1556]